MEKTLKIISLTTLFLATTFISADNRIRNENIKHVSRYITLNPAATQAQRNPMKGVIPHIHFRNNIKTVGQALQNLLKDSGYKLTRHHPDKHVLSLLRLPLPHIHRNMGPLTLEEALNTLAGEPWELAVDPISRLVTFVLPSEFDKSLAIQRVNNPQYSNAQIKAIAKQYKKVIQKKPIQRKVKKKTIAKRKMVHKKVQKKRVAKKVQPSNKHQLSWNEVPKEFWITN
jgi:conjugative transfer region protein (TIGR03748 family)